MSNISSLLEKLDNSLGKNKRKNKIDYKELAELKKKNFMKLKDGKNNVVFVSPISGTDPFTFWHYHNGLQEVAYYSVPCDAGNKNESCIICDTVESLQKEDYEGNKHIWYPIIAKTEFYAPVINVESESTIAEGLKWLRVSKTVMTQLTEWLRNLEGDDKEFFDDEEPQKVIITYNKSLAPADQYKLDKKNYKGFSDQQLADWRGELKPVADYILSKSQNETKKIVDEYFERIANEVATKSTDEAAQDVASGKLDKFKK